MTCIIVFAGLWYGASHPRSSDGFPLDGRALLCLFILAAWMGPVTTIIILWSFFCQFNVMAASQPYNSLSRTGLCLQAIVLFLAALTQALDNTLGPAVYVMAFQLGLFAMGQGLLALVQSCFQTDSDMTNTPLDADAAQGTETAPLLPRNRPVTDEQRGSSERHDLMVAVGLVVVVGLIISLPALLSPGWSYHASSVQNRAARTM